MAQEMAAKLEELAQLVTTQTQELQELRAKFARLEGVNPAAQILETRSNPPVTANNIPNSRKLGRRRLLRNLAGGLLAGATAVSANLVFSTGEAQAKLVVKGANLGGITTPEASTITGTLTNTASIGLIASGLPALSLADISSLNIGLYSTGSDYGVYATNVQGTAISGSGQSGVAGFGTTGYGVFGSSKSGYGVFGSSKSGYGVRADSISGDGVHGSTLTGNGVAGDSGAVGVLGTSYAFTSSALPSTTSVGVLAIAGTTLPLNSFSGNQNIGLYAIAGPDGSRASYAGIFAGSVVIYNNLNVNGNISKAGGSFKIDHPLDPQHKYLYHSFVESPDMLNIYSGVVQLDGQGGATVQLPNWFEALNRDFRYQLTALGSASPNLHIAQQVNSNSFKIAGGQPGQEISWQVTGIRQDKWANANRIPVEQDKPEEMQNRYLHPELY